MPFKSEAQRAKLASLVEQGKFSKASFDEWATATGDAKLPDRVGRKPSKPKPKKRIGRYG
jgi:hypothetical protein